MSKLRLIFISLLLPGFLLWTFWSCRPDMSGDDLLLEEGDTKEVRFVLGGAYAAHGEPGTKTTAVDVNTYNGETPLSLPEGSTVWLMCQTYTLIRYETVPGRWPWYEDEITPIYDWVTDSYRSYVVLNAHDGFNSLYPCAVDAAGNALMETMEPAMYLEPGEYRFFAVSPALPWVNTDVANLSMKLENGQYLMANDARYTGANPSTNYTSVTVTTSDQVQVIRLNPMAYQTAQLRFTIRPGENVHRLDLMSSGIEISGLQDPGSGSYNWTPYGHYLEILPGNKRSQTTIRDFHIVQQDSSMVTNGQTVDLPEGSLMTHCGILPTDATSSSLIVVLHLQVNGIPTQYSMSLNRQIFEPGHSYHYVGEVSVTGGVTVFSWQNISWDADVEI